MRSHWGILKPGISSCSQSGPDVRSHVAEVLGDQTMGADLLEQHLEESFTMLAVVFAILIGCIVAVHEARQLAAGEFP